MLNRVQILFTTSPCINCCFTQKNSTMASNESTLFCSPTGSNNIRKSDQFGDGYFGASRGARVHKGVDFNIEANSTVYSPVFGKVVRTAAPYKSDDRFKGLVIEGLGRYAGYQIKIFYVDPQKEIVGRTVKQGETIGTAQDLTVKYPGITNHVHFEITLNGEQVDPSRYLQEEALCKN